MVAEWINADTEVGPSMASGSHEWSGNCADLPTAPANSPSATQVATATAISLAAMAWYSVSMSM